MPEPVSDSAFNMWRALFAMAHADAVITMEEKNFMHTVLAEQPFTPEQAGILRRDIDEKQDIVILFGNITDQHDRSAFFDHARNLVWIDGDFGADEQTIMTQLSRLHARSIDHATFAGVNTLSLAEPSAPPKAAAPKDSLGMRLLKALAGVQ